MQWAAKLFTFSLRVSLPLTVVALLMLASDGWCQQELRSGKKGVTNPAPVTSTAVDADTQALDVAIKAGSITLSGADGATLDGANSAIRATVFDRTNSNPLAVQTVDSNGDPVSAGGGTQYTEDAASAADPVGTQTICRRRDTLAAETTTDGDNTAANCTSKGELYVKHTDNLTVSNSFLLETFPNQDAFVAVSREWVAEHLQAAGRLALLAYLAVDPDGNDNSLLQDVVTEVDTESLIIVRRTVPV